MREVRFASYCMLTQKKSDLDWFEWCVFVDEGTPVLEAIQSVRYTLHPTFPDPIRTVTDKASRFVLYSAGWGGFTIAINVSFLDGSSLDTRYRLEMEPDMWPRGDEAAVLADGDAEKIFHALHHDKYRWRKLETLVKETGLPRDRIVALLDELERENLTRRAYFRSVDGKELWGATSVVGMAPRLS